jgi:hypothetical protein
MRAVRLFHTIVVIGSGIGSACGGRSMDTQSTSGASGVTSSASGAASSASGATSSVSQPGECQYISQFRCDSYNPASNCRCDPSLPEDAAACGGTSKFFCAQTVCASDTCIESTANADCHCQTDAPASPSDCPGGPGQFECNSYMPEFQGCDCNSALPGNPSDCSSSASFECAAYAPTYYGCRCDPNLEDETQCNNTQWCHYTCASEEPRYGCQCSCVVPIA